MPLNKSPKSNFIPLIAIFLIALFFRVVYWIFLKQNYFFYDHPSGDVAYYEQWAGEIASGQWLGTQAFWGMPLYPYFLAVIKRLTLNNLFLIHLVHIFLGSLNCVLVYVIARRLFSREAALLSGILLAGSFTAIHYDYLLVPVPLLIFFSLVIVLAFLNRDNLKSWREWAILGFLTGLGALGDGKLLIFTGLTVVYLIWKEQYFRRERLLRNILPFLLMIMLVLGMTGARNKMVSGDWIWISAQNGLSFYVGNNPKATGVFENPDFIRPTHGGQDQDQTIAAEAIAKRSLSPNEVAHFWRSQAFAFIRNNPLEYFKLLGHKIRLFFTDTEYAYDMDMLFQRDWKRYWDINPFWLLCPLALAGMWLARKNKETLFSNFMILGQFLFTIIFFLTDRHRTTILPFLIIYESYLFIWLANQIRLKQLRPVLSVIVLLIIYLIVFRPQAMSEGEITFYRATKAGSVYEDKGDSQQAHAQYLAALTLRPNDTNAMYNLANIYANTNQWPKAVGYYEKILLLNPYHIDALFNLGFIQQAQGDYPQSLTTLKRLLEIQPESVDALFVMGRVLQKTGECVAGENYFKRLLQLRPDFAKEVKPLMGHCQP